MEQLQIAVGDKVEHATFGKGTVTAVWGEGEQTKVTVKFAKEVGEKKLLVRMANLKILSDRTQLLPDEENDDAQAEELSKSDE
ncbi:MAG: hypothetical protein D6691_02325 [Candidatus Hydrogenedentota bacterium]|jgi:DNA helicase-2/ATP-dependent DNA helicase PcrA|uniref:Uncharacterized protein n=1 Tax=Sumerlaea chitinivorans TaxID=2250252 RepID=A0A2Z4Y5Q2_SUMC1|nr:hypothetical protein BRCON_1255 [Candidatus Sumerlaea chitinivorans]MCX7964749.1 hypothetical protein [Candidatus Sumerlaea chitinivorans]RMH29664.1 MAG: hypothetical protein D6691_02325 [Candidatus Hydrogenedentota bacterium]GIX44013.1 MAG: hypothetical protein KatS3mg130_0421 [Candidatus Sumerlaea sp.]